MILKSEIKRIWELQNEVVTQKGKNPLVIQVCYLLDRELGGLYEALTFFGQKKGLVVTLNQSDTFTSKDMTALVVPAWEFLGKPAA